MPPQSEPSRTEAEDRVEFTLGTLEADGVTIWGSLGSQSPVCLAQQVLDKDSVSESEQHPGVQPGYTWEG